MPRRRSSSTIGWWTASASASACSRSMPGHRRVAAHAAGVRPFVAVVDPLVVLGRRHRHRALAVAEREQRQLLALEELLEHDLGVAEAPLGEELLDRRARRRLVGADHHALAGGERVGLEHERIGRARRAARAPPCASRAPRSPRSERPPRASAPWRSASSPRCWAASPLGPNARIPASASASTTPATSGTSGPTTTRSTSRSRGRGDDSVDVLGADVEALHLVLGDARRCPARTAAPGTAGCAAAAHERVLAPAAADHQDPRHV